MPFTVTTIGEAVAHTSVFGGAISGHFERDTVVGLDKVDAILAAFPQTTAKQLGGVLYREMERVMGVAKTRVPHETGVLEGTGHVQLPVYEYGDVSVTAGFNTPYALKQHEDATLHHKEGRTAFYLSGPFDEAAPTMDERMAADLGARLGLR
jgi:hypothetical protein